MNWLNIRTESLHSPEFIGCNPTRRATWLSLSLWCASQENGGIVSGGATWSDRQWQQTCGVTKREATDSCSLYRVDGDSVVLWGYPSEKENEVQALREAGRLGGLARTSAKVAAARANGAKRNPSKTKAELGSEPKHEPKPNPSLNPTELEGERKENKNENKKDVGENETAAVAATTSAELVLGDEAKAAKPEKQTDAQWLAGIKADPAFAGIDVEREHAKCLRWCSENGKQQTRRRFINWLNRCDRPICAVVSAEQQRSEELSKVNGYEY